MPLDQLTLQNAVFALNTKLVELAFKWDLQKQLLFTPASFDKPLQKILTDNIRHLDKSIRDFTNEVAFSGLAHFIEFVPEEHYIPEARHMLAARTQIRAYSPGGQEVPAVFTRAIIRNERIINLLAEVGSVVKRVNFAKMLPWFFKLNPFTPYELCDCTAETFLNSSVRIDFEKLACVYIKKESANQNLMDHQKFFEQNGLKVENFTFNQAHYFRISCLDWDLFAAKLRDLQLSGLQPPVAAAVPAAPKMIIPQNSYAGIQAGLAQTYTAFAGLGHPISEQNSNAEEYDDENDNLASRVSALDSLNEQLQEECSNLQAENKKLKQQVNELEDSCKVLTQAVANSHQTIETLEKKNQQTEALERKPNSPAAAALARQVTSLQAETQESAQKLSRLEKENAALKDEVASLRSSGLRPASLNPERKENNQSHNEIELQPVSREGTSLLDRQVEKTDTSSRWCKCTIS